MTLLLGGSVLLIGGSAVALVLGWLNANEGFVWTSIAATLGAAVLLVIAFLRSRQEAPAAATAGPTSGGAEIDPEILADRDKRSKEKYARANTRGSDAAGETAVMDPATDEAGSDDDEDEEDGEEDEEDGDAAAPGAGTVVTPAAGTIITTGPTPESEAPAGPDDGEDATAATVGPLAGTSGDSGTVVGIPKTKKFHSAGCRFASAKGAETMDRATAEERGYQPCGVCKP
ncbi:MAG TPA: hypothetical protein VEV82_07335 [Actinomycetota bacterium]|nr:hypothetical protein [Actinomycetota bacterium]